MFPNVREVVFARWLTPGDSASSIAAYRIDGRLSVTDYARFAGGAPSGEAASLEQRLARAGELIRRRLFVEAMDELVQAQRQAPDHPDILVNLGALQVHFGDSTAALATLGHAIRVAPGDREGRYNLGLLQWRMGKREEARATWAPLLAEVPESDLARAVKDLLAGRAR
jgi:Flp pilus assembly protein TadD